MIPGQIISNNKYITLNKDYQSIKICVANLGDRPIQIGSHFHFFEVNKFLLFDRKLAFGKRLNIPTGTAIRFEPGDEKTIELIDFGGHKKIIGFNNLVNGIANKTNLLDALLKLKQAKFMNKEDTDEL